MKKILIFSFAYYPKHYGGAEVAIKEITDRIPLSDIEFHLVTNRFDNTLPKESKEGNVYVHRIGIATKEPTMADLKKFPLSLNKLLFQFLAAKKAVQLHKEHHFDAIWAMMAHSCGVPAVLFKMRYPNVPYLLTLQEGDPIPYIEKKMRPLWPLFTRAFTKADHIQVISTFLGDWARARGFTGSLSIVPNAVDVVHFAQPYTEEEIASAKKDMGKKEGDVYLVTTSRLVKKNAVDDVIRALPLLPPYVHFIVFGTGPNGEALQKLAGDLGVSDRVQFRGQLAHKDMPKYLKASDIFIRPSRSEGMGNSFVEAMAAGLPIIATQEGGISDFLFDEKRNPDKETTGWAIDADSPKQIAEAVQDILNNPEKVARVRETSEKMVRTTYDWNLIAEEMRGIFSQLVHAV